MRRVTAPVPTQEGLTCWAYSSTRITNRILELTGNKSDNNITDILQWCNHDGTSVGTKEGAKSDEVLKKMISMEWPGNLPTNTIRLYLDVKTYHPFSETNSKLILEALTSKMRKEIICAKFINDMKKNMQCVMNALTSKREVICAMFIDTTIFSTYGSTNDKIMADENFPLYPTHENSPNCFWHDVVLFKWEDGLLYFKNSHGSKWGINGYFIVSEQTLICAPNNFEFIDLCFKTDKNGNIVDEKGNIHADIQQTIDEFRPCPIVLIKTIPINNSIYEDMPVQIIGKGFQAKVLLGKCKINNVNTTVAIRQCIVDNVERLSFESQLYNFDHLNIVKMYGYKVINKTLTDSQVSIAMERMNCNLTYFYSKFTYGIVNFEINWGLFYFMVLDVASGLSYLNREGVVHGDICSDNIVMSSSGVAKLIDFQGSALCGTFYHKVGGHTDWVEERRTNYPIDYYTDMYSVGKLMIYLLYGTVSPPGVDFIMGGISQTSRIPQAIYNLICNCINPIKLQRPKAEKFIDKFNIAFMNQQIPTIVRMPTDAGVYVGSSGDGSGMRRFTNGTAQIGQFSRDGDFIEESAIIVPISPTKVSYIGYYNYLVWYIGSIPHIENIALLLVVAVISIVVLLIADNMSQAEAIDNLESELTSQEAKLQTDSDLLFMKNAILNMSNSHAQAMNKLQLALSDAKNLSLSAT